MELRREELWGIREAGGEAVGRKTLRGGHQNPGWHWRQGELRQI